MSIVENKNISDVIINEGDPDFTRDVKVVLDGQTLEMGYVCYADNNGKMKRIAAETGVNEVQTNTFSAAMTAGILDITVFAPDGTPLAVAVPWNTDWAGTMADWNTAMTAAATAWYGGASAGAVMTGTATAQVLTFSGNGFAKLAIPELAVADVSGTTGPTSSSIVQTTAGGPAAVNEVQTTTLNAAMTAGVLKYTVYMSDGASLIVAVDWDTDWATTMAAWNVEMTRLATIWNGGVASVGAVMTGTATAQVLTFSGVGVAGQPIPKIAAVDITGMTGPASVSSAVRTTTGVAADTYDVAGICLENDVAPSGADGSAVFLVRGPATVKREGLNYNSLGEATIKSQLLALNIKVVESPVVTTGAS